LRELSLEMHNELEKSVHPESSMSLPNLPYLQKLRLMVKCACYDRIQFFPKFTMLREVDIDVEFISLNEIPVLFENLSNSKSLERLHIHTMYKRVLDTALVMQSLCKLIKSLRMIEDLVLCMQEGKIYLSILDLISCMKALIGLRKLRRVMIKFPNNSEIVKIFGAQHTSELDRLIEKLKKAHNYLDVCKVKYSHDEGDEIDENDIEYMDDEEVDADEGEEVVVV